VQFLSDIQKTTWWLALVRTEQQLGLDKVCRTVRPPEQHTTVVSSTMKSSKSCTLEE
jgi:hypothetical protein